MPPLGFLVTLEANPGMEARVVEFLRAAKAFVDAEEGTVLWFAFRSGPTTFRIFDAFHTEVARQTHLHGKVREALEAHGSDLFSRPPVIEPVDIYETKLTAGTAPGLPGPLHYGSVPRSDI
jgi:hypothetical protein